MTDANGRQRLVSTTEEQRIDRADGSFEVVRDIIEVDASGRSRTMRRESQVFVPEGDGVFLTRIEIAESSPNGGRFVPTQLVEQREQRDGDQVVAQERTTFIDPTGRGRWEVAEQRVLTQDYSSQRIDAVEVVYRPDASGDLVLSERTVSRERSGAGGRTVRTDEVYGPDINRPGALTRRPVQEVETVQVERSDGGLETTQTVSEMRGERLQAVERVIERTRPDGRGGTEVEREVQRADVNGRFQTVSTSRVRSSGQ